MSDSSAPPDPRSPETGDAVALLKRYHAALVDFDADVVASMFAADAEYHSPGTGVRRGRDAIIAAMKRYFGEFPDQRAVDEEVELAGPRMVRSRWRLTATSRITGQSISRRGIEVVTFGGDGLIVRVEVEDQ